MKILFVWPNKDSFGFKPIGLSLLSGIARSLGWEIKLFDTTEIDFGFVDNTQSGENAKIFKPVDFSKYNLKKKKLDLGLKFEEVIKKFNPDCLAISVLSDEFLIAVKISSIAKKVNPKIIIIWGGKYPTLNPEKTLVEHYADFVCIGDGADAFRVFLISILEGRSLYGIPNIWGKNKNSIVKNIIAPLKNNLDDLPYVDWSIFDKRQFLKPFDGKIYIGGDHMLNWGCPYHCTYCINHFYHKLYNNKYFIRRYSIKRIIDELEYLKGNYNLEFYRFHDEDFLLRPLHNLRELSEAYKDRVNIPFSIETNSRSVTREKVKLLKDMNCASVTIAIETGDQKLRKNLLRRVDSGKDIIKAFSLFNDAGIRTSSFNMLGIPFESRRMYMKTVEINRKARPQYPNVGFFYPFEGTELREISVKMGLFNPVENQGNVYRRTAPTLTFNNLTNQELIEMRNVFVLYVKLPKRYWAFIRLSEQRNALGVKLRKKILEIYDKTVWNNNGWYKDNGLEETYLKELRDTVKINK